MKTKGHLGTCIANSFDKNLAIIINHHSNHGEQLTKQRVTFLIVCWKGEQRETARTLKDKYLEFLRLTREQQQTEMEKAKQYLSDGLVTEVSETEYGTKVIYKVENPLAEYQRKRDFSKTTEPRK